jgi:hypothetical protein
MVVVVAAACCFDCCVVFGRETSPGSLLSPLSVKIQLSCADGSGLQQQISYVVVNIIMMYRVRVSQRGFPVGVGE